MKKTMKHILKLSALILLLATACKDDDEPSAKDVKLNMLTVSPWAHAQVTHADGDLSSQYTEFVISFSKNSSNGYDGMYVISNGGYAFTEDGGHWKFNANLDQIILDSGKVMDFVLEENHLQLDFNVANPGGRIEGVSGHFVFDLQPL